MAFIDSLSLTGQGLGGLRQMALAIAEAGLAAADGALATHRRVKRVNGGLKVGDRFHPLPDDRRLLVLGGGKASLPVARALEEILGDRIDDGLLILNRGETAELEQIEVMVADHPLPSEDSLAAGARMFDLAATARSGDLVLTCFTGGRSALLSLPPAGVSFEAKHHLHQLLLSSGMPISKINTVRKHVSRIKGGRLAARIAPAEIVNLFISDVAGDPLDILGDLTTQDSSTPSDAWSVLEEFHLLKEVPESILSHLRSPETAAPDLSGVTFQNELLVTGETVATAMAERAVDLNLEVKMLYRPLEGEATEVGSRIAAEAIRIRGPKDPPTLAGSSGVALVGCGGESTVTLQRGEFGSGGPNQEAAIAAALQIKGQPASLIFLDTDGSDGGTWAAGAIVDGLTCERAEKEENLDLNQALLFHQSTEPLEILSDLIVTGPTGTNLNDLFVAVTTRESTAKT